MHTALPLASGQQITLPNSLEVTSTFVVREQGAWFEEELDFATEEIVQEGWSVLDIGASYGLYTLALSVRVGPTGRVVSFEPGPDSVVALRETLALNSITNVALVDCALLDKVGTARLQYHGSPELNALQLGDHVGVTTPGSYVKTTTLDTYLESNGIDCETVKFVKMDVEGAETKVLAGGASLFEAASPIVLFEVNNAGTWNTEVVRAFERRGYACYQLLPGPKVLVPFDAHSGDIDPYVLNLFAIKPKQAQELAARNLLLQPPAELGEEVPPAEERAQELLRDYPTAYVELLQSPAYRELLPSWKVALPTPETAAKDSTRLPSTPPSMAAAPVTVVDGSVSLAVGDDPSQETKVSRRKRRAALVKVANDENSVVAVAQERITPPHIECMNLYAMACNTTLPREERWLALQESWKRLSLLCADPHRCSRVQLLLCARVAADIALRSRAVAALHVLIQRGLASPSEATGLSQAAASANADNMWASPFLAPRRAEQEILHHTMGLGRREAWYEASLLLEAVRLQWFSLCFAPPHAVVEAVVALQRVIDLGFYLAEASRQIHTLQERDRQCEQSMAADVGST